MKKILNIIFFTCLSFLLSSCRNEWSIELYAQKIEGTSKILYKYDASGGRDTMISGYSLLDSTESFEVDISKNLPFSYLEDIPNKKYILGVEFEKPNYEISENTKIQIFTPIKSLNITEDKTQIKTKIYQYDGFMTRSVGYENYEFESFKETRDSLYFYKLDDVTSLNRKHLDVLKFKKNNIAIDQNENLEIIRIRIEDLILSKKSNEIISNIEYCLKPKTKIKSNLFSDYGVFKKTSNKVLD